MNCYYYFWMHNLYKVSEYYSLSHYFYWLVTVDTFSGLSGTILVTKWRLSGNGQLHIFNTPTRLDTKRVLQIKTYFENHVLWRITFCLEHWNICLLLSHKESPKISAKSNCGRKLSLGLLSPDGCHWSALSTGQLLCHHGSI